MFHIGDQVVYGTNGVCKICDITSREVLKETVKYFVLSPVSDQKSTFFIPINNQRLTDKMLPLLSKADIDSIVDQAADKEDIWIADESQRKEAFTTILNSGDRLDLVILVRSLLHHKNMLAGRGKQLHISDKKIYHFARKMIDDEFSVVLGIQPEEVQHYIAKNNA